MNLLYLFIIIISNQLICEENFETKITSKKEITYEFVMPEKTSEEFEKFTQLSTNEKDLFFKNRAVLLKSVADKAETLISKTKIEFILKKIDSVLWENPSLISKANELGISLQTGADASILLRQYGFYLSSGLGITSSFNRDEKYFAFEIYKDLDIGQKAYPFTAGTGILGRLLVSANYYDPKVPLSIERGKSLCGLGMIACLSEKNLRIGLGTSIGFGLPIGGLVLNRHFHAPIFRIMLSQKWPYIRMRAIGVDSMVKKISKITSVTCNRIISALSINQYRPYD